LLLIARITVIKRRQVAAQPGVKTARITKALKQEFALAAGKEL